MSWFSWNLLKLPNIFSFIAALELAHVNLVVAVFIWVMIYPMMVQVDFSSIKEVSNKPKGLILTLLINWMIKPFTMAALGWLFFKVFFVFPVLVLSVASIPPIF